MLLPLLVASVMAHALTVLTLKRSILTEKVARRGYHLSREYAVDPLEILFVREVMRPQRGGAAGAGTLGEMQILSARRLDIRQQQRLLPVVDSDGELVGVLTRADIREAIASGGDTALRSLLRELCG